MSVGIPDVGAGKMVVAANVHARKAIELHKGGDQWRPDLAHMVMEKRYHAPSSWQPMAGRDVDMLDFFIKNGSATNRNFLLDFGDVLRQMVYSDVSVASPSDAIFARMLVSRYMARLQKMSGIAPVGEVVKESRPVASGPFARVKIHEIGDEIAISGLAEAELSEYLGELRKTAPELADKLPQAQAKGKLGCKLAAEYREMKKDVQESFKENLENALQQWKATAQKAKEGEAAPGPVTVPSVLQEPTELAIIHVFEEVVWEKVAMEAEAALRRREEQHAEERSQEEKERQEIEEQQEEDLREAIRKDVERSELRRTAVKQDQQRHDLLTEVDEEETSEHEGRDIQSSEEAQAIEDKQLLTQAERAQKSEEEYDILLDSGMPEGSLPPPEPRP